MSGKLQGSLLKKRSTPHWVLFGWVGQSRNPFSFQDNPEFMGAVEGRERISGYRSRNDDEEQISMFESIVCECSRTKRARAQRRDRIRRLAQTRFCQFDVWWDLPPNNIDLRSRIQVYSGTGWVGNTAWKGSPGG